MGKESDIPTPSASDTLARHQAAGAQGPLADSTRAEGSSIAAGPFPVIHGGPADFFAAQRVAFKATLDGSTGAGTQDLMPQAFENLESNIRRRTEGKPPIACGKGCSTCCRSFRVTATGPEIFAVARAIRALPDANQKDLADRVATAEDRMRDMADTERHRLNYPCPMLGNDGGCTVYAARPLACRGHASYDQQACLDVAAGLRRDIPVSMPHLQTRHLVQTALEAALLDVGLEPGQYELNRALRIALADPAAEEKWFRGVDIMSKALSPASKNSAHGVTAVIKMLENHQSKKNSGPA
jgi:Fe-S-cluster containining protein